ncbi:hypothetical protein [Bacillus cereus]|nr:hypothetical protein [Bacillus cereus]
MKNLQGPLIVKVIKLQETNQVDLVTKSEVEQANWFTRFMRGIGSFFSGK